MSGIVVPKLDTRDDFLVLEGIIKKFIEDTTKKTLPSSVDRAVRFGQIFEFLEILTPGQKIQHERNVKSGFQEVSNIQNFNNHCKEVYGFKEEDCVHPTTEEDAKSIKQILVNLYRIIDAARKKGFTQVELAKKEELPQPTEKEIVRATAIMKNEKPPEPEEREVVSLVEEKPKEDEDIKKRTTQNAQENTQQKQETERKPDAAATAAAAGNKCNMKLILIVVAVVIVLYMLMK